MKFIDEAIIEVHAGKGGDGVATFRREKYVPRGGPNGGDGGRGGSVHALADRNVNTLVEYRFARIHRAKNGETVWAPTATASGGDDIVLPCRSAPSMRDADTDEVVADLAGTESEPCWHAAEKAVSATSISNRARIARRGNSRPASPASRASSRSSCKPAGRCRAARPAQRRQVHFHPRRIGRAPEGRGLPLHDAAPASGCRACG